METGSSSHMTCLLRLDTQTSGWDKSIHKVFKGIQDVTYSIDATRGLAYLSGKISPEIILRITKANKHAQLLRIDYGYSNPCFPPESPMFAPNSPYNPYIPPPGRIPITTLNHQDNYVELPLPQQPYYQYPPYNQPAMTPYYYYPYYDPGVMYSPPPQPPTRDAGTGEQQCRIL